MSWPPASGPTCGGWRSKGLAALGFGIGFNFAEVPSALAEEADRLGFPVLEVPYEVPFVAITKTAVSHLASEQLEQLTQAIAVHERLADAVLKGRGLNDLLGIVCGHLDCSLQLLDETGRVVSERHSGHAFRSRPRSSCPSSRARSWRC